MHKKKSRFSGLETTAAKRPDGGGGAVVRDAEYYLRAGLQLDLAGRHEKALNSYSAALGEDPLCITAWTRQLWMLLYMEEPIEAEVWADKALQSFPKDPDILSLKSLAQWRNGARDSARDLNDAALAAARDSANVWLARGEMQIDGNMKSATTCFTHAVSAPGLEGLAHMRAGDILLRLDKFAEAAEFYRKAARSLPESSWIWYGYGRAQRELGNDEYAIAAFDRALNLSPRDPRYRDAKHRALGWRLRLARWLRNLWRRPRKEKTP